MLSSLALAKSLWLRWPLDDLALPSIAISLQHKFYMYLALTDDHNTEGHL